MVFYWYEKERISTKKRKAMGVSTRSRDEERRSNVDGSSCLF